MRRTAILLLSLAVVASGCSQLMNSQTPKQQFKSQIQDMTSSTYHVTYEVDMDISGLGQMIAGAIEEPEIYNTGEQSKAVVDVTGMTFAVYDLFKNRTVTCSEGSLYGMSDGGVECSYTDTGSVEFDSYMENITIERNGTQTVADRKCNMYVIRSNESIDSAVPEQASQYSEYANGSINICLDKQKGYPAKITVESESGESSLRGENTSQSMSLKAVEYEEDFSEDIFEIPVNVATSASCEPFQLNVTTFDYSGKTTISVNEENRTVSLEANSKRTLNFDNSTRESGTNSFKVYAGDQTVEESCYFYSYGNGLGIDSPLGDY